MRQLSWRYNQKGFTLVEAMIGAGMITLLAVGVFYLLALSASTEKKADAWLDEYRVELQRALNDPVAWQNTLNDSVNSDPSTGPLACLKLGTDCTAATVAGGLRFRLLDRDGVVISDTNAPETGFTATGRPCNEFDAVNGSRSCPYRVALWWSALCTANCTNPEFVVNARFFHRPVGAPSENVGRYNFRSYQNSTVDSIAATCVNQGGAAGVDTCAIDPLLPCPAGQAITGFDANNIKICGLIAANYTCPADEFLQGVDDWGNAICSRCP